MSIDCFFKSNHTFSFEALRAAGYSNYGGADLAEVVAICAAIRPGNEDDWLQASNYFRTAEFFRWENYDKDELAQLLYMSSETYFEKAMALSPYAYEAVTIPYEKTTLRGYFVAVDKTDKPRKTIIFNGGYDSTSSEGWFAIGAAAPARGYNFLAFDGPGQGGAIRKQKLHFRPDWEYVLTPVVDYALTRTDVDASRIAVFGWSMGGYLVARAGTREHRAAALILDDGVLDFGAAFRAKQPAFVQRLLEQKYDGVCDWLFGMMAATSTGIRWALLNGQWTLGVRSASELARATRAYTKVGISQDIKTPCLVMDAENDHFLNGQPELLRRTLTCENESVSLRAEEGADTHCHQGAFFRTHQVIFDYLAKRIKEDDA
ncbi:dipeptidyl aminopeptidase/acylaminoacyl peptidase [Beauveria brongniartii RCEF 3172]|uniref:Dipeptidyl aminopeptidase/acylaminoacyl peptidase n=1 Tax=Beauveria brongniartii RCEF 3172 TaxID=1081107 RepID=A0A167GLJ5_9HYPO|nr:dipeptidyl aminopeptidase/acylaminoacyl peptidase [Beauveria brongniartii RCEF 3172]